MEGGDLSLQGRDSFRALGAFLNVSFLPFEVHSILSRTLRVESLLASDGPCLRWGLSFLLVRSTVFVKALIQSLICKVIMLAQDSLTGTHHFLLLLLYSLSDIIKVDFWRL
jgi:hypothetical protein